jgi:hypothetical protein
MVFGPLFILGNNVDVGASNGSTCEEKWTYRGSKEVQIILIGWINSHESFRLKTLTSLTL